MFLFFSPLLFSLLFISIRLVSVFFVLFYYSALYLVIMISSPFINNFSKPLLSLTRFTIVSLPYLISVHGEIGKAKTIQVGDWTPPCC